MDKYNVSGMSCAACSSRVEKAVSGVEGVENCSVNLLTGVMVVEGTANEESIKDAVIKAGYGVEKQGEKTEKVKENSLEDKETPMLLKRLLWSVGFLIVLMYFSMGAVMWGFPLPEFFEGNPMSIGLLELLLCICVMIINKKFFISGTKAVINKAPNMDTLVAMGSGASFIYSVYALFVMSDALISGDIAKAHHMLHELYFESAAMILALITVGKSLESYSKGKTTSALKSLMELAPDTAVLIKDGKEVEVPLAEVKKGDIFVLRPGAKIPVDGIVEEGNSAVDEAALTGESIPCDKEEGDRVFAGCINLSGFIKCRATKVGEDTTLSQIIKMVSDASSDKAPVAKVADKVSGIFVPFVLLIAAITLAVWLVAGKDIGFSLARAISVLVISCPCALGLATPVAIMVGNGKGARCGILFKTATALENAGKCDVVALDKTGTITKGQPQVVKVFSDKEEELLKAAYSLELKSEHPLGKAVVNYGEEKNIRACETENFEIKSGGGLSALIDGETVAGGNLRFIKEFINVTEDAEKEAEKMAEEGSTPIYFCRGEKLLGIIAVADTIKEDSEKAIKQLKNAGIKVVMLTGDNKKTAEAIGKAAGVDDIFSEVLPGDKERIIKELQKEGKVMMVGDGINDAPALTRADTGVAIGAGQDVAIDAADVVLVKSSLSDAVSAIALSRKTLKNIHENLFWAFIYNVIGIPLAAGVYINIFGWQLNPMFGAAAMSLSSFCVCMNALRLNFADINNLKKHIKIKKVKEKGEMKVTLKIEGMMCPHCEARVKSVLEAIDGVEEVWASHESKTAEITLSKEVDTELLKKTVTDQGYKIIE